MRFSASSRRTTGDSLPTSDAVDAFARAARVAAGPAAGAVVPDAAVAPKVAVLPADPACALADACAAPVTLAEARAVTSGSPATRITAIRAPTSTWPPTGTRISTSTPAAGAGT